MDTAKSLQEKIDRLEEELIQRKEEYLADKLTSEKYKTVHNTILSQISELRREIRSRYTPTTIAPERQKVIV
jgi:hypothetical protein